MLRLHRIGLILAVMLLVSTGCTPTAPSSSSATPAFIERPAAMTEAPDFTLLTPDGQTLALHDYRGQVILINFWASWCTTCAAEMHALNTYYQDHKDEGFTIIAVNYREPADVTAAYIAEEALTFPVVLDQKGEIARTYNVTGIPTSFFVDRNGQLLGYWPGALLHYMLEQSLTPLLLEE